MQIPLAIAGEAIAIVNAKTAIKVFMEPPKCPSGAIVRQTPSYDKCHSSGSNWRTPRKTARFARHSRETGIMADTLQTQVAAIWARTLGVKAVAPADNFFALGGHSLLGVKLLAEIQAKTGIEEELRLSDLLEFPTL